MGRDNVGLEGLNDEKKMMNDFKRRLLDYSGAA